MEPDRSALNNSVVRCRPHICSPAASQTTRSASGVRCPLASLCSAWRASGVANIWQLLAGWRIGNAIDFADFACVTNQLTDLVTIACDDRSVGSDDLGPTIEHSG